MLSPRVQSTALLCSRASAAVKHAPGFFLQRSSPLLCASVSSWAKLGGLADTSSTPTHRVAEALWQRPEQHLTDWWRHCTNTACRVLASAQAQFSAVLGRYPIALPHPLHVSLMCSVWLRWVTHRAR